LPSDQQWPAELDALIAAPGNHRLLFENDSVRVLETQIAPGSTTPLHTHRWPASLYILSSSDFIRRDGNGNVLLDSRTVSAIPAGTAVWSPSLGPHTLENIGSTEIRVIVVELKQETD
jgi:quercetin dioxygenase-like cupin family protein